jgi:hypothetical protein
MQSNWRSHRTQNKVATLDSFFLAINTNLLGFAPMSQELWEENLSASVTLQIMEVMEKFLEAVAAGKVMTDYVKLDCITTIFTGFLSRSQPLPFWKAFIPVFSKLFKTHGATLMGRENDRFLKQVVFHLLRLAVFRNDSIRERAVVGLQLLVRVGFFISLCCKVWV